MLAGNVVTTAIREASLREQIAQSEEIVSLQARQLAIAERMEALGGVARVDVVAQQRDLAQARAALPDLRRDAGEDAAPACACTSACRPARRTCPSSAWPSCSCRPSCRSACRRSSHASAPTSARPRPLLARAGAQVGVATANLYPQLTLSAQLGSLSTNASDLFGGGTGFYLLGASLVQPLFRGGELQARRRSAVAAYSALQRAALAVAAYEQAGAAYQEAVLQGFQNVADALRALEADAARLKERTDAVDRARRYRDITAQRLKAGGVSEAAMLEATRHYHRAMLEQTQAAADRYADSAALLQALGGGWWQEAR